jgi:hypothetical protein
MTRDGLKRKTKKYDIKYMCGSNEHSIATSLWYNLANPFQYFQCNELFTIEKLVIHLILHKFIYVNLIPPKNLNEWILDPISV